MCCRRGPFRHTKRDRRGDAGRTLWYNHIRIAAIELVTRLGAGRQVAQISLHLGDVGAFFRRAEFRDRDRRKNGDNKHHE